MKLRRRDFISLVGGAAAWPIAARGQQKAVPVVGLLEPTPNRVPFDTAFRQGLSEAGFAEGQNLAFDRRSADGQSDRLPALAAELVRRRPALIFASTPPAVLATKVATTTIPIVFVIGSDPVKDGLVSNLARPGSNITGVTAFANLPTAKRLELLHGIASNAVLIGFILNPNNANAELELTEAQAAARSLGLRLIVAKATTEDEIDSAFTEFVQQHVTALLIAGDIYLNNLRYRQITALALRHGFATCFSGREPVEGGGLLSYGANFSDSYRQAGVYVGRILKGEKATDLPILQPTKFEFVINRQTAKALGLTIPPGLLAIADEVIE
jgi:putative ABC transport system substrate-binding protein